MDVAQNNYLATYDHGTAPSHYRQRRDTPQGQGQDQGQGRGQPAAAEQLVRREISQAFPGPEPVRGGDAPPPVEVGVAPRGHPLGLSQKSRVDWREQQTQVDKTVGGPGTSGQFFTGPEAQQLRVRGGTYQGCAGGTSEAPTITY